jgi:hypothetical protein
MPGNRKKLDFAYLSTSSHQAAGEFLLPFLHFCVYIDVALPSIHSFSPDCYLPGQAVFSGTSARDTRARLSAILEGEKLRQTSSSVGK